MTRPSSPVASPASPREALRALQESVERLVMAGAELARGSADLASAQAALAPLAARATVIARGLALAREASEARGKRAAAALLELAARLHQVTFATAPLATVTGERADLPKVTALNSPLRLAELAPLVDALTGASGARRRAHLLRDAVARGRARDLRLVPLAIAALADRAIAPLVAEELLPSLGPTAALALREALALPGGEPDARKLQAIARIEGAAARPLLERAVALGSPRVRAKAIRELAAVDPIAAEPLARARLAEDEVDEVKVAAALALSVATSDASLEALVAAFTSAPRLHAGTGLALAASPHPEATARILSLLTPDLKELAPRAAPPLSRWIGARAAQEKARAAEERRDYEGALERLTAVLALLGGRKDPRATAALLEIFRAHAVPKARDAAARALLASGYAGAFDELAPAVYDADFTTRAELIEHVFADAARAPTRAFDRLGRFLDPASFTTERHITFAAHLLDALASGAQIASGVASEGDELEEEDDPAEEDETDTPAHAEASERSGAAARILAEDERWTLACVALLGHEELTSPALDVLAGVRSAHALETVLTLAARPIPPRHAFRMLQVLVGYPDARVAATLPRFLSALHGYWGRRAAYRAMRAYDDPAVAPALVAWTSGRRRVDRRERAELDELLRFLRRDRAVASSPRR